MFPVLTKLETARAPILTDTLNRVPLQPSDVDVIQHPRGKKSRIGAMLIFNSLLWSCCFLRVQRLVFCIHLYRFCKKFIQWLEINKTCIWFGGGKNGLYCSKWTYLSTCEDQRQPLAASARLLPWKGKWSTCQTWQWLGMHLPAERNL